MLLHFRVNDKLIDLEIHPATDGFEVVWGRKTWRVQIETAKDAFRTARVNGRPVRFGWHFAGSAHEIVLDGLTIPVALRDPRGEALAVAAQSTRGPRRLSVTAPIPGLVKNILVKVGAAVKEGDPLLTLDAMKLENEIPAPSSGKVKAIHVKPGMPVERDALLVTIG